MKPTKRESALYKVCGQYDAEVVHKYGQRVTVAGGGGVLTRVTEGVAGEDFPAWVSKKDLQNAYKVPGTEVEQKYTNTQGLPLTAIFLESSGGKVWATVEVDIASLIKALQVHKVDGSESVTVEIGEYGLELISSNGRILSRLFRFV